MKYKSGISKVERERIFKMFLNNHKLKFSDIEKALGIRSNMVAYHISQMEKEGILVKDGFYYSLSDTAERYIPVFSHVTGEEMSPLPVLLIAVTYKDKVLFIKRNKRPYKDYWTMVGGKIRFHESFKDACIRLVAEKTGLNGKYISTNSIFHERVVDKKMVKHAFILIMTKFEASSMNFKESEHGMLKWFDKGRLPEKIVPSDLWLVENKLDSTIAIDALDWEDIEN